MATEQRVLQNARNEMYAIRKRVLSDDFDGLSKKELKELRSHLRETYAGTGRTDAHPNIFAECDTRIAAKLEAITAKRRFIISLIVSLIILGIGTANLLKNYTAPPLQAPNAVGAACVDGESIVACARPQRA